MSILLQALKKSESQRELGSVPTLQTNTELLNAGDQQPPAWLPAVLVLSAALLITWIGLGQFRVSESLPDADLVQSEERRGNEEESKADGDVKSRSDSELSAAVGEAEKNRAQANILPQLSGTELLPSEDLTDEQQQAPAQRRLGREVRDYTANETPSSGKTAGRETIRENAIRQPEVAKVELERQRVDSADSQQNAGSAQSVNAADVYEPEIISYWQVPEKMREGLPDLRISVLVFAEQPENRFVLLNGERLREGEELSNGLLLEEIRRDRAIFNYRNYRFFLKG
jgi:general secretion pathway protein B